MRVGLRRGVASFAGMVAALCIWGCSNVRLVDVPGDVRDVAGQPIPDCTVELILQSQLTDDWTTYRSRSVATDAAGGFRFSAFAGFASRYRLRVRHAGYQEWSLEGRWPASAQRYHVTLLPGEPAPTAESRP